MGSQSWGKDNYTWRPGSEPAKDTSVGRAEDPANSRTGWVLFPATFFPPIKKSRASFVFLLCILP